MRDEEANIGFFPNGVNEDSNNFQMNLTIPPRITIEIEPPDNEGVKEEVEKEEGECTHLVKEDEVNGLKISKCRKCQKTIPNSLTLLKPFREWVKSSISDEFGNQNEGKCRKHSFSTKEGMEGDSYADDCEFLTRLHLAAKYGNSDELENLLGQGENPNLRDCSGRTPLHFSVNLECNEDACFANALKCLTILLKHPTIDINAQDNAGETALHVAAESQFSKGVSTLIYNGADVYIKSNRGVRALTMIVERVPKSLNCIMNRAISVDKYDTNSVKCEVKLDFGPLIGYADGNRGMSFKNGSSVASPSPPSGGIGDGGIVGNGTTFKPRRETQLLNYVLTARAASRNKILTHPAISAFLILKWRRVRPFFLANLFLQTILLLMYTFYILDVYLINCPYRPKITEPAAVKAAKAQGLILNENDTYIHEYIRFTWFSFKPEIKEIPEETKTILQGKECHLEIGPTVKSTLLLALTISLNIFEMFKMLPAPRDYLRRNVNIMTWVLYFFIYLTCWPAFMTFPNITFWQYQAAAFGLFLGWIIMLLHIGKFPSLGIYVDILGQVLKNFGFFMLTYASLLIAFALSFCVLFPGNAPYASIPLAILKVLTQMIGEVDYELLFYGNEDSPVDDLVYPFTGHLLYAIFVIIVTIVLCNLLVGLTVSDIQSLRKDAQLAKIKCQISEMHQMESFIFSKKVEKIVPDPILRFIQNRLSIARDGLLHKTEGSYNEKDTCKPLFEYKPPHELYLEHCAFIFRPNDVNEKSFSEDLKASLLRLATTGPQKKKGSKCIHNLINLKETVTTPSFEDFPSPFSNSTSQQTNNHSQSQQKLYPPPFLTHRDGMESYSSNNIRGSSTGRPGQDFDMCKFEEKLKRLEDKLMDRMIIQMDTLYQRIEEKLMEVK